MTRGGAPGSAVLVALAHGLALLAFLSGCESPSSRVDGADLRGVFDGDAGPKPSASASPTASTGSSATPVPSASASAKASLPPRAPEGEGCVEVGAPPRVDVTRTVGRPGCRGAEVMEWRDPSGAPRYACLYAAPGARGRLPLVVFLHGDGPGLDTPTAVQKQTSLRGLQRSFAMGGDEPGFHVLAVQGRALAGEPTVSFDADSAGPANLDVVAIDRFVGEVTARGIVDRRRVYAVGLGPGGRMAATWAMVHADRVAAFASFAAPPPTARWTCPGPPPPGVVLYRACDAIVSCEGVESWLAAREQARAETRAFRLGDDAREVVHCEVRNSCGSKRGTAAHSRWPKGLEKRILEALAQHALAVEKGG